MAAPADAVAIEVVHARPDRQWLLPLTVPSGTTVRAAVLASPLARECPGLDLETAPLGVWGERVPDGRVVRSGDRVEVYRELVRDPRAARRAAVARGGTLGRGRPPG